VTQIRILIADDQPEVRAALRLLLGLQHNIAVIGEAAEAKELAACLEQQSADVLLIDWELPGLIILDWLCVIRKLAPHLRIVALSGLPEARQQALAAGVDTFISKTDPPDVLLKTLRSLGIDTLH
jgi:DNA-binding NarL/FixJ family response regulator